MKPKLQQGTVSFYQAERKLGDGEVDFVVRKSDEMIYYQVMADMTVEKHRAEKVFCCLRREKRLKKMVFAKANCHLKSPEKGGFLVEISQ